MTRRGDLALGALSLVLTRASPAIAAPPPSFTIYNAAGSEEDGAIPLKVCKHGTLNASSSTVTLYTVDGTAKAGSDFKAIRITLTFGAAASCQSPLLELVNDQDPEATETLTVKLAKGTNARLYDGTAIVTITDSDVASPPPPPPPDPDPPPPPPPGGWVSAPLVAGGYARATATCSSIFRTAQTDRVGISYPGVAGGIVYRAIAWGHTSWPNVEGKSGNLWTVAPIGDEDTANWPYVPASCLEGVKPA